jgi:polyferredoxin
MTASVRLATVRRLSQIAFFFITGHWLLMGFFRCPFGVPFVSCAACPLGDCSGRFLFWPMLGLLVFSAVAVGRAFCGWVCPLGYVQDALWFLRPSPGPGGRTPGGVDSPWLRWIKFAVLCLVVWLVVRLNIAPERGHPYVVRSPSAANWESVAVAWRLGAWRYAVRGGLLAAILVAALAVPRFWCRHLCPLGALLSIANRCSFFRLRKMPAACTQCGKYPRQCVQGTVPGTGNCIVCGDCVPGCPTNAIFLDHSRHAPAEAPAPPQCSEAAPP